MIAALCGAKGETREVMAPASAARIRALVAEHDGFGLVEPDLPLGKLPLPRDPVDRAILAIVTRGRPRALLFVRGSKAKLAPVKDERALDFAVTLVHPWSTEDPLFAAALAVLTERGATAGKELLREARARRGGASTRDAADLGRALVRAWSAGAIELA
ncbi:MAG: hypothetical protein U0270_33185 [Labilithrix sp.]